MVSIEELTTAHKQICEKALNIAIQRGDEYATREETLKTFKEVGEEMRMHPAYVALVLLSIKHKRIIQQFQHGEPIEDSVVDNINYGIYAQVLLDDEVIIKPTKMALSRRDKK